MVTRLKYGDGEMVIGEHGGTVGRIVHVWNGYAAHVGVITAVGEGGAVVQLLDGTYLPAGGHNSGWVPFAPTYKVGHWTWPPKIRKSADGAWEIEP